jgi:hypothetical protein
LSAARGQARTATAWTSAATRRGIQAYQATDIAAENMLVDWLRQKPADIVTMHLGTVDLLKGMRSGPQVLEALGKLVE